MASLQECLLMNRSILGLAATVLLTLTVQTGFAAGLVHVPATPQAAASASLIARADRALRDYVAACSTGNEEAVARIVTTDALSAHRSVNAEPTGTGAHISNLWIFPTSDSNTVFIHYTTGSGVRSPAELPDSEHLALLEMRGDRIFKMLLLGANAGNLSALEASVVTRAIASSRVNAHH